MVNGWLVGGFNHVELFQFFYTEYLLICLMVCWLTNIFFKRAAQPLTSWRNCGEETSRKPLWLVVQQGFPRTIFPSTTRHEPFIHFEQNPYHLLFNHQPMIFPWTNAVSDQKPLGLVAPSMGASPSWPPRTLPRRARALERRWTPRSARRRIVGGWSWCWVGGLGTNRWSLTQTSNTSS